jgi:hypothetical protein
MERACHSSHGLNDAGDEGRLHFADGVIDGDAPAFVEDLDTEDLCRTHGTVLVGATERDVEWQHLIGIPGRCYLLARRGVGQRVVEHIDGRSDGWARGAYDGGAEYLSTVGDVGICWTDFIDIGNECACTLLNEVQS